MCGIVGVIGPRDDECLAQMCDALVHRGPDGFGYYSDGQVSLGHRRLSIIDLQNGSQPMKNEDGSVVLVFNGEIYNYLQLRRALEEHGHEFATNSDTESIIHAYEHFEMDAVQKLDGMFAFVLYDKANRILFGARDRMGKKPLYVTTRPFGSGSSRVSFAFASEVKSLRRHPVINADLRLSTNGLVSYLVNDYVAGSESIYDGIAKLRPGHAFVYGLPGSRIEGFRSWRYWDLSIGASDGYRVPSEKEACDEVLELLGAAVQRRLMSDVPLGVLLSGGIDSSCIVALMTRFRPAAEIKTFSIGFDVDSFDESDHAAQVAHHFGTDHRTRRFTVDEMKQRVTQVTENLDEPFADPSILPVSMLSEFAREEVTVALGGDGGDELFAGYDPFCAVTPAKWYRRVVPSLVHARLIEPLTELLPASAENMALQFKVSRFLRGALVDPRLRSAVWMGPFSMAQLRRLIPGIAADLSLETAYASVLDGQDTEGKHVDELDQAIDFFQRFYLPDDILVKVDRASMMHSLELRSPFLDTALVEYVNKLPNRLKLRRGITKYLLKRALMGNGSPTIPAAIIKRRKKGFGIPVARWIRKDLFATFQRVLIDDWPSTLDMFDRSEIERLFRAHVSGAQNNYKELWSLFVLATWLRAEAMSVGPAALSTLQFVSKQQPAMQQ